jgi:carboxypeptidase family protein
MIHVMRRLSALVASMVAASALGSAQIGQPARPPQPQQQQGQTPPAPGTSTIRGHVFAADTGQPLRKAQVRITAGEIRENRMATTDANGAYEFTEVRAGRYTVSATKGSYVTMSYGQDRATDAAKPLEILDRQTVERLDLSLPRGSIVTGRIVDEFGEPMSDVSVSAQRYQFAQGRRQLMPTGRFAQTNDLGEFRLFGVPPGQYYLVATWRNAAGMNPNGNPSERIAFPTTYFPGSMNLSEARRVTLAVGQEIDGLVMTMRAIRAVRVSGTATGSDGKSLAPAMIFASQSSAFNVEMSGTAQVRPDGTFTMNGLVPGEYMLRAQRMGSSGEGPETAALKIVVGSEDLDNVQLTAVKPSTAKARVIVDPAAAQQLPSNLTFMLTAAVPSGIPAPPPPPAPMAEDYSLDLKSPPGVMRIILGGFGPPPAGWSIRAVRVNGVDVTDTGVEFKPNEELTGLEVELTNRIASVSGVVTNSRGEVEKNYTAVAFAQDKARWTGLSRYQGQGRPDQDGRFRISSLPPGDYYIVAVDRIEPGQANDPEFLERVYQGAKSLTLGEGESKTIDLRLTVVP